MCHTMTAIYNNRFVMFGGWGDDEHRFNDLYIYDADADMWTAAECSGDIPCSRSTHSLTAINEGRQLILFAGYKGDEVRVNDIHILDIDSLTWKRVDTTGPKPAPRNTHTATLLKTGHILVFGGRDEFHFFNDVWLLDTNTMRWEELNMEGEKPRGRSGHTAVLVREQNVMVFGGWAGGYSRFDDLYELNTRTLKWTKHHPTGRLPRQRSGHSAALLTPTTMVIFGGWGLQTYLSDVCLLDLDTLCWRTIKPKGKHPEPRRFHSMTTLNDKLYIFGGKNDKIQFEDLVVLHFGIRPLVDQCLDVLVGNFEKMENMIEYLPLELKKKLMKLKATKDERRKKIEERRARAGQGARVEGEGVDNNNSEGQDNNNEREEEEEEENEEQNRQQEAQMALFFQLLDTHDVSRS